MENEIKLNVEENLIKELRELQKNKLERIHKESVNDLTSEYIVWHSLRELIYLLNHLN